MGGVDLPVQRECKFKQKLSEKGKRLISFLAETRRSVERQKNDGSGDILGRRVALQYSTHGCMSIRMT